MQPKYLARTANVPTPCSPLPLQKNPCHLPVVPPSFRGTNNVPAGLIASSNPPSSCSPLQMCTLPLGKEPTLSRAHFAMAKGPGRGYSFPIRFFRITKLVPEGDTQFGKIPLFPDYLFTAHYSLLSALTFSNGTISP